MTTLLNPLPISILQYGEEYYSYLQAVLKLRIKYPSNYCQLQEYAGAFIDTHEAILEAMQPFDIAPMFQNEEEE